MTKMQIKPKGEMNSPKVSKINWTAIIGAVCAVAVVLGANEVSLEKQAEIVAAIAVIQSALIWVWRTFFTKPDLSS